MHTMNDDTSKVDRIYRAIVQATYKRPVGSALADVQQMAIAQRNPVAFVEAIERFEAATETGEEFCFV